MIEKKNSLIRNISFVLLLILVVVMIPLQADASLKKPKITNLSNDAAGCIGVMFNSDSDASGYQIVYSKNKSFSKKSKIYASTNYYGQITYLEKGTYYVKVRAYVIKQGKEVFGSYSNVKKVKVTNGAIKISFGKEKKGKLTKSESAVAYTVNGKTATWVNFKISAYANESDSKKGEWCFQVKEGEYEDLALFNLDDNVIKNTIYDSPYYTYTSAEPIYIPAGKHCFTISVPEYMFEGKSSYKLYYKIMIIETDRP